MWMLLLTLLTSCAHQASYTPDSFHDVTYVKNYDGDTITFNIEGVHALIGDHIAVRLNGVDTAEMKTSDKCEKAKALEAKRFVKHELIKARRIDLKNIGRGKYFRIVADIHYDGKSLGKELFKRNLGYAYSGGEKPNTDWCK